MIIIYDSHTTQADLQAGNGALCVLRHVISCTRTMVFNGQYELEIQSVVDDDVKNHVKKKNIIKSPSGQFYIIYWMQYDSTTQLVNIKAKHIFYYLSARPVIHEGDFVDYNCYYAMRAVLDDEEQEAGFISYNFTVSSDITELKTINYYGQQKAYAIVGNPNSIVNLWGGELYRDNFYFSINHRMENSKENAFLIRDGWNTTGIKMTVDDTNSITSILGVDNVGQVFGISKGPDSGDPYSTYKIIKYSYADISKLEDDVGAYYEQYQSEAISYDVQLATIRKTNKDSPWIEVENFNVGDSGTIYSDVLGIAVTQKIIEQKYDEIAERVLSVKLGNYRNTIISHDRFAKLIAQDDSPGRRLDAIERHMLTTITKNDIENLFAEGGNNG